MRTKDIFCAAAAVVSAFFARIYGGWSEDMITLVICMSIDFVMGIAIAAVFKSSPKTENGALESRSCFKGLCRKCLILLLVLVAHRLDVSLGTDYIKTATVIGFIANELISIVENVGLMGVRLPAPVTRAIEMLKNRTEQEK